MITKISGEQPFQVLTSAFSISPSQSGYNLEISADGVNYSPLFTVGAGVTRLVTGVAANSYYRLAGNTSDVVVNWQKSCGGDGHDGGGGGTGATITVDSALSSSSTNPVENRVITNALAEIDGGTVDSALTSGSTNAVESRAIWYAINGVTTSTQMEISTVDSDIRMSYKVYGNNGVFSGDTLLKETNIPGYYSFDLGELNTGGVDGIYQIRITSFNFTGGYYYFAEQYYPTISLLGEKMYLNNRGGSYAFLNLMDLGNTYDYYLVLNTARNYVFLSTTLPVITGLEGGKPDFEDIPYAQDSSDTKYYVYDSNTKPVLRNTTTNMSVFLGNDKGGAYARTTSNNTSWTGATTASSNIMRSGNEIFPGLKTIRDSKTIDRAEEVLNGFEEQITLTLGNRSATDYMELAYENTYFYETDNPRFYVLPIVHSNTTFIGPVTLNGVQYRYDNYISETTNSYNMNGIYQLSSAAYSNMYVNTNVAGSNYIIVDKELLTLEIAESLTITRGRNLADAFVTPLDLTGGTETIVHTETIEILGDSGSISALTHRSGTTNTIYRPLKNTTNSSIYVLSLDDEYWYGKPYNFTLRNIEISGTTYYFVDGNDAGEGVNDSLSTSFLTTSIYVLEDFDGYMILDTSNMTVSFSNNLPSRTWTETVTITGVLDDYWTTAQTQTAIQEALYGAIITGATMPVDSQLSTASTNPVENRVITNKFADYYTGEELEQRFDAEEAWVDEQINNLTEYVDEALSGFTGSTIEVDDHLDSGSTNPVENQVITNALAEKVGMDYLDGYEGEEQVRIIDGAIILSAYEYKCNNGTVLLNNPFNYTTQEYLVAISLSSIRENYSETTQLAFSEITYPDGSIYHIVDVDTNMTSSDLGVNKNLVSGASGAGWIFRPENFDGTFDYFLLIDCITKKIKLVKNLPVNEDTGCVGGYQRILHGNIPGLVPIMDEYGFWGTTRDVVQSTSISTIVKCTQAQYDAMQSHDPNTFYIIVNS